MTDTDRKPPDDEKNKPPDNAAILLNLAGRLDDGAKALSDEERKYYRCHLRRMAQRSDARQRQIDIATSYEILIELEGERLKKESAGKVAMHYGCADQTVNDCHSTWKVEAKARLARMDRNVEYNGLKRAEMLERELESMWAVSLEDD